MPEFADMEYMGGIVRVVKDPNGFVQHITEPGGLFSFLEDAWKDYQEACDAFFATPVSDAKIIEAGKNWEGFGRTLIGFAGTAFNDNQNDPEKQRMLLEIYERFSKDMAVVQLNISKYRQIVRSAAEPDQAAVKKADEAKIESSRRMQRALNTEFHFRRLWQKGETCAGTEMEMEKECAEKTEKLFEKFPEPGIFRPANIYPPIPLPEAGKRVPEHPEPYERVMDLPVEDLAFDEEAQELVVRPGYISEDGLIDDESLVWHPEEGTVTMKFRGGEPVTWPYWKPKDTSDVFDRDSRVAQYLRRYFLQCMADLEMKVFDPERVVPLDGAFWRKLGSPRGEPGGQTG